MSGPHLERKHRIGGESMKKAKYIGMGAVLTILLAGTLWGAAEIFGVRAEASARGGALLVLDKEFYEALNGGSNGRTYSSDKNREYLRQISVSTKYMVETNFRILEQQERMIQLLESIAGKK